jgi:hypothetical protein
MEVCIQGRKTSENVYGHEPYICRFHTKYKYAAKKTMVICS